jgi:mono/diheme cytochrome c family protein
MKNQSNNTNYGASDAIVLILSNCRVFRFSICTFLFVFLKCSTTYAQIDTAHGASLFQRCSGCHKLDIQLIGPALGPQITSETDDKYLIRWIHNNQALITAKHPRAVAIFNRYNQSIMPAFTELSDKDINDIIGYVRAKWKDMQAVGQNTIRNDNATGSARADIGDRFLIGILFFLTVVCLIAVLLLSRALKLASKILDSHNSKVGE